MIILALLFRWRPRATAYGCLIYLGVLGACAVVGGFGRLFLRFYGPQHIWTPWVTDPGPGADAVAFLLGFLVVVLTAAALLEMTDPNRKAAQR